MTEQQSEKQTTTTPATPNIGELWEEQGGIVAGIMPSENGKPAYYLIVPTHPAAQPEPLEWGGYGHKIEGLNDHDGKSNTQILLDSSESHPAAKFCADIVIGQHDDFYLPSRREGLLISATVPNLFEEYWYWTSSQYSDHYAFLQDFSDGDQGNNHKDYDYRVRAVRRFIIN